MSVLPPSKETFLQSLWSDDTSFSTAVRRCIVAALVILGLWVAWRPVGGVVVIGGFLFNGSQGGDSEHGIHMLWRGVQYLFIFGCISTIPIGIWRSTAKRLAPKHSTAIARLAATVCALLAVLTFAGVGEFTLAMGRLHDLDMRDVHDSSRTSKNAAASLDRSADFPLTGFWQSKCGDDVGIAIERESRWLKVYRLEDCGILHCGRARSTTTIYNDPNYRVVDPNTIELNASAEPRYRSIIHRCG
jgi:hypothetical protein